MAHDDVWLDTSTGDIGRKVGKQRSMVIMQTAGGGQWLTAPYLLRRPTQAELAEQEYRAEWEEGSD